MSGLHRFGGVLAFVLAAVAPVSAQQAEPAGHVKTVSGAAFVVPAEGHYRGTGRATPSSPATSCARRPAAPSASR